MYYPLYISEENSFSLLKDEKHNFELFPKTNEKEMCWNWSREKFIKEASDVLIIR